MQHADAPSQRPPAGWRLSSAPVARRSAPRMQSCNTSTRAMHVRTKTHSREVSTAANIPVVKLQVAFEARGLLLDVPDDAQTSQHEI